MNFKKISLFAMSTISALVIIAAQNISSALPIGPDKYFLDMKYGQTFNETLYLYGRQEMTSSETLYLYVVTMEKVGEQHDRKFYFPDENDSTEVANWITLPYDKVTVAPGETVEVNWSITFKGSANCGTNLAAIMVADSEIGVENKADINELSIGSQIMSQIHVNVLSDSNGECTNLSNHLNLITFNLKKKFPVFIMDNNIDFITKIENTGNLIARSPKGYIEIDGYNQDTNIPFNDLDYDVYPHTTRKFDDTLVDENFPNNANFFKKLLYEIRNLRIGKYTAELGISKNVQPAITASLTYWVIPWRIILTIIIIILLIVARIVLKKKMEEK